MWGSSGDTTTWSLQGFRLDTNRHGVSTCCVPAAQCRRLCPHTDPLRLPWKIHFKGFKGALNCSPMFRAGMTPRDGSETDDHDVLPYLLFRPLQSALGSQETCRDKALCHGSHWDILILQEPLAVWQLPIMNWAGTAGTRGKQYVISLGGNAQVTIFILYSQ